MSSSIFAGKEDEQTVVAKPRRKSSKAMETHNKKPRQRGMGVEKLERLRIQESWKEINNITPPSLPLPLPLPYGGFMLPNGAEGGGRNFIPSPVEFSSQNVGPSGGAFFPSLQQQRYLCCGVENVNSKDLHYSIPNLDQYCADDVYKGAKVVALHRKENRTAGGGGNLLMEYEFFPGRSHNELLVLKMMKLGGQLVSDDAIALSIGMGGFGTHHHQDQDQDQAAAEDDYASTCIDLSLKLSY